ncbi:hypothetical protein [Dyadobacter soli]|nr:hypothetical protein [Dyadobacter soli]
MEKQKTKETQPSTEEILADKERIFEAIRNSPFLNRKHQEAAEYLSKIKPPFPWDEECPQNEE